MIQIQCDIANAPQILSRNFRARVRKAWEGMQGVGEVVVRITDDASVRQLNAQYRNIDRVTDVLSFPYEDWEGVTAGGDVVIAWGRAQQQAKQREITPQEELLRLTAHGLAHICGYTHDTQEDFAIMREVEARALAVML